MISTFSILFLSALLSPLLWRRGDILKISAVVALLISLPFSDMVIPLAGFEATELSTLFISVLVIVLSAIVIHSDDDSTITQTLFLGSASVALIESHSLLSFIISFEAVSLISVVLVSRISNAREAEGAVKIFVAGAIATAILMFGLFLYTIDGGKLLSPLKSDLGYYGKSGVMIMLLAVFYKLTIFPMHNWAIDTYSKARANHAALLSGVAKTSAVVGAFTVFASALRGMETLSIPIIVTLSIITMTLGNFSALAQKSLAKILAWSSVAHAGYMLIAFASLKSRFAEVGLVYMAIAYIFMQSAVFLVLDIIRRDKLESLSDIAGLGAKRPILSAIFTIQLLSLAGIPLLAGFMGKAVLFYAGVDAGLWQIVLIALLNSALSVGYYAWIIKHIWFDKSSSKVVAEPISIFELISQAILLAGTIYFGIFAVTVFGIN